MAPKRKQTDMVGRTINGWLILEELPLPDIEFRNNMHRYTSRRFITRHLRTGVEIEKSLYGMRNSAGLLVSERRGFKDHTGEVINDWEVLSLANDTLYNQSKRGHVSLWNIKSTRTGKTQVAPYFKIHRLSH